MWYVWDWHLQSQFAPHHRMYTMTFFSLKYSKIDNNVSRIFVGFFVSQIATLHWHFSYWLCTGSFSCMMTSSNENIFPVTGPLCGEFTAARAFLLTANCRGCHLLINILFLDLHFDMFSLDGCHFDIFDWTYETWKWYIASCKDDLYQRWANDRASCNSLCWIYVICNYTAFHQSRFNFLHAESFILNFYQI